MAGHKNILSKEALRIKEELQQYFVHSSFGCPYGLPYRAVYHQALFDTMPDFILGAYLASGYRRNGNVIYTMHCKECVRCVPIRINPQEFKTNRNQKRVWQKNQDIEIAVSPLSCSQENLELLEKFLAGRYPGRENSAIDYYTDFFINHITTTVEFSYRIDSRLIGVAIVDLSPSWLNGVFFYFDPAESKRSPGTFNILHLVEFCRQKNIEFVYLGYWINDVKSMKYKKNFKPHHVFRDGTWHLVEH
jgi:arginyl-tRNA--protein-N-Asp/Glu arginylyltransferase